MSEWLDLTNVCAREGLAQRPIAWRGDALIERNHFLADVSSWHAAFLAQPGSRVALYFNDSYAFAAALYGAWHAGKEVYLPGDAQPATLNQLLPQMDGVAGDLPGAMVPVRGTSGPVCLQPLSLRETRLVVFTSGSSGSPLAIPKHLAQLQAETNTLQTVFGTYMDAAGPATVYSTVSHQHIYGLLFCTLWPLAAGRPFVTERLVYPEQMAERLGERASVLVSSPAHLKRLPDTIDWQSARRGLRGVFSSGGPLPPESALTALQLMGHSPAEVYGSSETGGIAWRQRALHGDHWQPLSGIQWRIEDELLAVQSPHLADEAWWRTSDRVAAHPDGSFVLQGRSDRVVKIEEKRVSLTAVEMALTACDQVAEARTLVVDMPAGPRLAAAIVPTEAGWIELRERGKRAVNEALRTHVLQTVERIALPRRFRYVRSLPVNTQGKSTEMLLAALFKPLQPEARWLERGPQQAVVVLDIHPDLAVFDGHFPEIAVLPGVAQLDWAIEFAHSVFPLPARCLRVEALKFQRPVLPGGSLELRLNWQPEKSQLDFSFRSDAGIYSSGRIILGPGD